MTSIPEQPHGPDLDALRKDIDDLKETPTEELIEPTPAAIRGRAGARAHRCPRLRGLG